MRSAQRLRAEHQAKLRLLLLWRERLARRSDKPKGWVLDNELVVDLSQWGASTRAQFEALLDARPRAPRRARDELWDVVSAPLQPEDLDIPLLQAPDPHWREPLKRMQAVIAGIATELDLPEGLLCSRRHLESLIAARTWPRALHGWRQPLLEAPLTALLT
jgi:ribonuclease D